MINYSHHILQFGARVNRFHVFLTANLFQLVFGICWLPLSFPVYAMTSPSDKGISQKSYQNSRMRLSSVGKKRQKDIE